jgi:uncharacterized surface protein with fasciclin (FAS1) repeats
MKKFYRWSSILSLLVIILLCITGCKKMDINLTTTEDANIVDYMRKSPDQFSEFVKILERTNVSSYLNAYGAYTVFAPSNDAIKAYVKEAGKASVDDMDTAVLRNMVRLHLIQDTISTSSFTDGKLSTPTMYGQFLITGVNDAGATVINRQGVVLRPNLLTSNGYIHQIDHVLQPASLTVAKMIEQAPKYGIFTQALKATGFYDSLNINNNPDTTRKWLSVLAESDAVLKTGGINSYADLVRKYNNTGNPKRKDDSLFLYVAYHILPGIKYVADIVTLPSHTTLAPLEVITTALVNESVLLNETTFNGAFEAGVAINRTASDNSATNGVVHSLAGNIFLKVRFPVRVDFDLGAQPEILKLTSIYRKAGKSQSFSLGQLSEVTWQNANLQAASYYAEAATSTNNYWKDDGFSTNLRFGNAAANAWIEFVTPLIVKGKYKVWICYRVSNQGAFTQVSVDDVPLPRIVNFTAGLPDKAATDAVLESQGFKRYSSNNPNVNNLGQLAGTVDINITDRHRIRLQAIRDNGSGNTNAVTLDFIQFIPINEDQTRPLFARDGSVIK